jgi:glutamate-ammonia-ligase adenylyltransferase
MRERIEREFGTHNPWDIKYARGGIIDVDFIAQYLLLRHGRLPAGEPPRSARDIFAWLGRCGLLETEPCNELMAADAFLVQALGILRLCSFRAPEADTLPGGLKTLLAQSLGAPDFRAASDRLVAVESCVMAHYISLLNHP